MQLPEVPWVRFAGLLSERERLEALEAATIVVVPSPYESLSLLALEAMAVGTPVLCKGHSEVLVEHAARATPDSGTTVATSSWTPRNSSWPTTVCAARWGRNGKEYVKREYRWGAILTKYDRLLTAVRQR